MSEPVLVATISGTFLLLGYIVTLIGIKSKNKTDSETAIRALISSEQEKELKKAYGDRDRVQLLLTAAAGIIRDLYRQWIGKRPTLDPEDINVLEHTDVVPYEWLDQPSEGAADAH